MVSKDSMKEWKDLTGSSISTTPWIGWTLVFVLVAAILFIVLWIFKTAFGVFGFDLTWWETAVVWLAIAITAGALRK